MMFGDVGHGLLLAALGLALRRARAPRWQGARRLWAFPFACGLAAAAAGLLYGEAFGPTGLVPDAVAGAAGRAGAAARRRGRRSASLLLAISYVLGIVNRWREDGPAPRCSRPPASPGFAAVRAASAWLGVRLYAGRAPLAARRPRDRPRRPRACSRSAFVREAGPVAAARRRRWRSSSSTPLRASRRTSSRSPGSAAFGLMHAAIGSIVLDGARGALGQPGRRARSRGVVVFVVGNAAGVRARGARGGRPGDAAGVLRAVLAPLRGRGPAVPSRGGFPWCGEAAHDRLAPRGRARWRSCGRRSRSAGEHPARAARRRAPRGRRERRDRRGGAGAGRRASRSASSIRPGCRPRRGGAELRARRCIGAGDRDRRARRSAPAIAVAYTGAAALAAISEKPELFGRAMVVRRPRRGDRDLRADRRHHPHRQGVSRRSAIGERRAAGRLRARRRRGHAADDDEAVRAAWRRARPTTSRCLILTPSARAALGERLARARRGSVWASLPR